MKHINWKSLLPTYPKYGERYSLATKVGLWVSCLTLITAGIFIVFGREWRTLFVAAGIAYIALWLLYTITFNALTNQLKELLKQSAETSKANSKNHATKSSDPTLSTSQGL